MTRRYCQFLRYGEARAYMTLRRTLVIARRCDVSNDPIELFYLGWIDIPKPETLCGVRLTRLEGLGRLRALTDTILRDSYE